MTARAFTLVELLTVIAIIITLMALTTVAFQNVQKGASLNQAGTLVLSNFQLARQEAISRNEPVAVLFYSITAAGDSNPAFRAIQLWESPNDGSAPRPLSAKERFPQRISILEDPGISTILDTPGIAAATSEDNRFGTPPYKGFLFRPNGSADLQPHPDSSWFLTLAAKESAKGSSGRPANVYVIAVDELTGKASVFRP